MTVPVQCKDAISFPMTLDLTAMVHPVPADVQPLQSQPGRHSDETQPQEPAVYDLVAVLLHRGASAFAGHYVSIVKDEKTGTWWKYDDDVVTDMGVHPFKGAKWDAGSGDDPASEKAAAGKGGAGGKKAAGGKRGGGKAGVKKGGGRATKKAKANGAAEAKEDDELQVVDPQQENADANAAGGAAAPRGSAAGTQKGRQAAGRQAAASRAKAKRDGADAAAAPAGPAKRARKGQNGASAAPAAQLPPAAAPTGTPMPNGSAELAVVDVCSSEPVSRPGRGTPDGVGVPLRTVLCRHSLNLSQAPAASLEMSWLLASAGSRACQASHPSALFLHGGCLGLFVHLACWHRLTIALVLCRSALSSFMTCCRLGEGGKPRASSRQAACHRQRCGQPCRPPAARAEQQGCLHAAVRAAWQPAQQLRARRGR